MTRVAAAERAALAPRVAAAERAPLAPRVAAFAALCAYGVGHWSALVADAPAARLAAVAAIAVAGAALLGLSARLAGPRALRLAAAPLVAAATLAGGLAAAGLEPRLLQPAAWPELGDRLDQGLASLRTVDWPYAGSDDWSRLTVLLGAPALATLAAALAFWPARRATRLLRGAGLAVLLVLYGVPVTELELPAELARGALLALLVAAWIWPPRLRGRDARVAAVAVGGAALLAVPAAAALDREEPLFDYRDWNWFGTVGGTTFDWSHRYGPITWSREGTTLLLAKADRPLYWKLETLDSFDGFRWLRSPAAGARETAELPARFNPAWEEEVRFTVRNLRTNVVPVAGQPFSLRDAAPYEIAADGTTTALDGPLREGDTYRVRAYVPNPSRAELRGVRPGWTEDLRRYVTIGLPRSGETNLDGVGRAGDAARSSAGAQPAVAVRFWGDARGGTPRQERLLRESPYARTYALARRLATGEATLYDVVKRIERHLHDGYAYNERPPSQEYPLESFLFEDGIGYCQQFSGAMALMLRMNGIPARVVGGFAPGSYNRDRREFRIRDLDAHSWVEVLFPGYGWIQFDPTPSGAPTRSRSRADTAATAATGAMDSGPRGAAAERSMEPEQPVAAVGSSDRAIAPWTVALLLGGALIAALLGLWLRALIVARRAGGGSEEALRELEAALRRLGYALPPRTTLLALERRLARAAGPASAAYVRDIREHRFGGNGAPPSGGTTRWALRRELSRGGGLGGRVRGLLALPPFKPS